MSAKVNSRPSAAKVDTTDPNVRRLVYCMYRDMLGSYNSKANDIIGNLPKEMVREDQGIYKRLESIVRSNQTGGGNEGLTAASSTQEADRGGGPAPCIPPPPPPPPPVPGILPAMKIPTEIDYHQSAGPPKPTMAMAPGVPPPAIQNAMMTKDKKPFTYTPGGIDLSEIRSPRMQRRISRNAMAEGVSNELRPPGQACVPQPQVQTQMAPQSQPTTHLPPSVAAAIHPQMAVPVFPSAPVPQPPPQPPQQAVNVNHIPPSPPMPPPPPPPPLPVEPQHPPCSSSPPLPSPPPPLQVSPVTMKASPADVQFPFPPPQPPLPPPLPSSELASVPQQISPQPLLESKPILSAPPKTPSPPAPPKSASPPAPVMPASSPTFQKSASPPLPVQMPEPAVPPAAFKNEPGSIYVPHLPADSKLVSRPNLGAIYVPPVQVQPSTPTPPPTPQLAVGNSAVPSQLNKTPMPWLNTQSRLQNQVPPPPEFVQQIQQAAQEKRELQQQQQQKMANQQQGQTRIIPIKMEEPERKVIPVQRDQPPQMKEIPIQREEYQSQSAPSQQGPKTRIIPLHVEGREPPRSSVPTVSQAECQQEAAAFPPQSTTRIIPIHVEGKEPAPPAHQQYNQQRRTGQNGSESYQQLARDVADMSLQGLDKSNGRAPPMQSRSFRILQKITDTDDASADDMASVVMPGINGREAPAEFGGWSVDQGRMLRQMQKLENDDKELMDMFKAQVTEESGLHSEENPRYRGGHIPSRLFRMLDESVPRGPPVRQQQQVTMVDVQVGDQPAADVYAGCQPAHNPPVQGNLSQVPASQAQQAPEPKKYMGGHIPSRSFRILQQMTADDAPAPGESDM